VDEIAVVIGKGGGENRDEREGFSVAPSKKQGPASLNEDSGERVFKKIWKGEGACCMKGKTVSYQTVS